MARPFPILLLIVLLMGITYGLFNFPALIRFAAEQRRFLLMLATLGTLVITALEVAALHQKTKPSVPGGTPTALSREDKWSLFAKLIAAAVIILTILGSAEDLAGVKVDAQTKVIFRS